MKTLNFVLKKKKKIRRPEVEIDLNISTPNKKLK